MNSKGNKLKDTPEVSRVLEQVLNNLKDCRKFFDHNGELEDKIELSIYQILNLKYPDPRDLIKNCDK
jgi:hypothetical protein